jgi:hypothetical protein
MDTLDVNKVARRLISLCFGSTFGDKTRSSKLNFIIMQMCFFRRRDWRELLKRKRSR